MKRRNFLDIKRKIFLSFFIFVLGCFGCLFIGGLVYAQTPGAILTTDPIIEGQLAEDSAGFWSKFSWEKTWEELKKELTKVGSHALQTTITSTLNQIAYDTATYIGSGGEGQKPLFFTEGWGGFWKNVGDSAAGTFIEEMGKETFGEKFNICQPNFALKLKIGLGLVQYQRPKAPTCTFSQMQQNWEEALSKDTFLNDLQDMFNPTSNDLGIALTIQTKMLEDVELQKNLKAEDRKESKGWLDFRGIDEVRKSFPGETQMEAQFSLDAWANNMAQYTGDALIDAANVFINQFAITLLKTKLRELANGKPSITGPGNFDFNWMGYDSGPNRGGVTAIKDQLRKIIEPAFNTRGDYNILAELTICPNPTKAGPTNCVINSKFRQAVEKKITVGQAMKEGFLNPEGIFGFTTDNLEPTYESGYPYRSMMILRKFRIIPVGWELAAQHIKDNFSAVGGAKNINDLVNCFSDKDEYEGYYQSWCKGLVDPGWLLKAPLNYCKREGAGPEIISKQVTGTGDSSKLAITRNDNYCADEQSCVKERSDGSCDTYGYCTQEKGRWNFDGSSCDPTYNTCQTFRSSDGKTVSYLQNTLDYANCSVDNVGCTAYCEDYNYASGSFTCTALAGNKLFLNRNNEDCSSEAEGCHEFVRTKAGLGANIIGNTGFETLVGASDRADDGVADNFELWGSIGQAVTDKYEGALSVKLSGPLNYSRTIDAPGFLLSGETFTLSFYAKDCTGRASLASKNIDITADGTWKYYQITYSYPVVASNIMTFSINGGTNCKVDAIKLERGSTATTYSAHRENGLIYEKLLPKYLESICYQSGSYKYKDVNNDGNPDVAVCADYARKCDVDELGCELYTSSKDGVSIPAKVGAEDYCPAECVDYDDYLQTETFFDSSRPAYFIPKKAKTCGSSSVGCDQFTNLDKVAQGGEGIEYFSYLRRCIKPNDPAATCADFYTWEGSNETGYQLIVHKLQSLNNEPVVTESDSSECNATIYNLSATDPGNNPDCREFYNNSGQIFYHLYSKTITCSDACNAYRRTEKNSVENLTQATCNPAGSGFANTSLSQFHWDATEEECYYCKNGVWNDEQQSCIYSALPEESKTCVAAQNGCREYSGSNGANVRIVVNNDFEGSVQGWVGAGGTQAILSSESLLAGGESLAVSGGAQKITLPASDRVQKGKSYYLTFIAKSKNATASFTGIGFDNGAGVVNFAASEGLTNKWKIYKLDLAELNHDITASENLFIDVTGDFYIDNVKLVEVVDRYYLIKDSWTTPDACFKDVFGNPADEFYNLGCSAYSDRDNKTNYLRRFTKLCQESAVGCELMIDTANSTDWKAATYNAGDRSEEKVSGDSFAYVVYNKDKLCNKADKGCQFLGQTNSYEGTILTQPVYKKNDPDKYSSTLCKNADVGCEEWTTGEGMTYFKNPGDQTCEWRQGTISGASSLAWYKTKVARCDANGNGSIGIGETKVCSKSKDCSTGVIGCSSNPSACGTIGTCIDDRCYNNCILDNNDYTCSTTEAFSIGLGGPGSRPKTPYRDAGGNNWVGICPASESGCTEYVEPISEFNTNLIKNADYKQDADNNGPDGWIGQSQQVGINQLYLYRFAARNDNANSTATINCTSDIWLKGSDGKFSGPLRSISLSLVSANTLYSKMFYQGFDQNCTVTMNNVGSNQNDYIELKKVIVAYQLEQDLNKTECNGIVDPKQGCVLFDERSIIGGGASGITFNPLIYNANIQTVNGSPSSCAGDNCNSNVIIKVTPDRTCDQWLACRSFVKDENEGNICFDVGLCDTFDVNGNCGHFVMPKKINQSYQDRIQTSGIKNLSGYSLVGNQNSSLGTDYYQIGAMKQVGQVARVSNGNFETFDESSYPIGWTFFGGSWDENKFSVIGNPNKTQTEGVGEAPEGGAFLRVGAKYNANSEFIEAEGSQDYFLSAYVNSKSLNSGKATINIIEYKLDGSVSRVDEQVVNLDYGQDWSYRMGRFGTYPETVRLKIVLYSTGNFGNVYFDDVSLSPVLNSKDSTYLNQTCRLYPKDDALSCDYINDSGVRNKGWKGYCLQYDRYPGSSAACLLWYPIDKVQGDGMEEGAGYAGKYPLYYCTGVEQNIKAKYEVGADNGFNLYINGVSVDNCWDDQGGCFFNPYTGQVDMQLGKATIAIYGTNNKSTYGLAMRLESPQSFSTVVTGLENGWKCVSVLKANGLQEGLDAGYTKVDFDDSTWPRPDKGTSNIDILNAQSIWGSGVSADGSEIIKDQAVWCRYTFEPKHSCTDIVQVVTPTGKNKYWSARASKGSIFEVDCNRDTPWLDKKCTYLSDGTPFGSVVPPADNWNLLSNPFEWDGRVGTGNEGYQPLFYEKADSKIARMGQEHSVTQTSFTDLNDLFAESYGTWHWTTGYMCADGNMPKTYIGTAIPTNCTNVCNNSICNTVFTAPADAPASPADIVATHIIDEVSPYQGDLMVYDSRGNYYIFDLDTRTWRPADAAFPTRSMRDIWTALNGGTYPVDAPPNLGLVEAAYEVETAPGQWIEYFIDSGKWYARRTWDNTWVKPSDWGFTTHNMSESWATAGVDSPPNPSSITVSYASRMSTVTSPTVRNFLFFLEGTNWYAFDVALGKFVPPSTFGDTDHSLIDNWTGVANAPQDIAALKVGYRTGNITALMDDTNWYAYNSDGIFLSTTTFALADNKLATLFGYATESKCSNSGVLCVPEAEDCPNSYCTQSGRYIPSTGQDWSVPKDACSGPSREDSSNQYCAIPPKIEHIKFNGNESTDVILNNNSFMELKFNSVVDSQQLPLVTYSVYWGDNEYTTVSGAEMFDKKNPANPHSVYHLYNYWDLKSKAVGVEGGSINCAADSRCLGKNCCIVKVSIKVKDNWGWCTNGFSGTPCPASLGGYVQSTRSIIVTE